MHVSSLQANPGLRGRRLGFLTLRALSSIPKFVGSEKSLQEIGHHGVKVFKISGLAQGFWRNRDQLGTRNELRNSGRVGKRVDVVDVVADNERRYLQITKLFF